MAALHKIEEPTGKTFGDPANPLLVSCRSGAKFSMPGMMDTVLNIGLNDDVAQGMIALTGDAALRLRRLPPPDPDVRHGGAGIAGRAVRGRHRWPHDAAGAASSNDAELTAEDWQAHHAEFKEIVAAHDRPRLPRRPVEQLRLATEAVFKSWNGKRAVDYRNAAGIAHDLGTAVNIVTMVFGNMGETRAPASP